MCRSKKLKLCMILSLIIGFNSHPTHAIQVDKIEKYVSCDSKNIYSEVINESQFTAYITAKISEYTKEASGILNGETIQYDEGVFKNVKLIAKPNKIILRSKEKNRVKFYQIGGVCDSKTDKVFNISYIPSAAATTKNTVKVLIGIGGILTIMPKAPVLSYELEKVDNGINIVNNGDSVIFLTIKKCEDESTECIVKDRIHHTRKKFIETTDFPKNYEITFTAPSNQLWIKKELIHD